MKLFVVVISLTIATGSFAQEYGVKAGLNSANMLMQDDDDTFSDDLDMKIGFHIGATAEFPINELFSFETGLFFTQKGYKFELTEEGEKHEDKLTLNYLEIPLQAKVNYDLGGSKIYGLLGPYLGFGISGKFEDEEESMDVEWGSGEEDHFKRLDFGLTIGAGVEISNITIGASYGLGLANISPHDEGGYKINNRVIGISVGYKF